jgi:hypothetical protein
MLFQNSSPDRPDELDPISDRELGVAAVLLVIIVVLATLAVPLIR